MAAWDWQPFQPLLLRWQDRQLGALPDPLIAIDGQKVKRSGGLAIASAIGPPSQRVHATITLKKDESEITAVRQRLEQTDFTGQLRGLDALHLQHETVPQILYDCGADYLLPLKGNQPTILAPARTLLPETLSPSGSVSVRVLPGQRPV